MDQLPIEIDFQRKVPLAEQIADQLRRIILAGMLKPGEPLPTVRQIAFQLRVNFNTVARAYRALDAEGLIITWQGRGSFVEKQSNLEEDGTTINQAAERLINRLFEEATIMKIPEETIWNILSGKLSGKASRRPDNRAYGNRKRRIAAGKINPANVVLPGLSPVRNKSGNRKRQSQHRKLRD